MRATVLPAMPSLFPDVGHSVVDLARELTTLVEAEAAYKANLAVIQTVDEMTDSLLDIFDNKERR